MPETWLNHFDVMFSDYVMILIFNCQPIVCNWKVKFNAAIEIYMDSFNI